LSRNKPLLTDLMVKYPYAPSSRTFFDDVSLDEALGSGEVQEQALGRVMSSLGQRRYEPHLSEYIEFCSFFAGAFLATQNTFLASRFSKREAAMGKELFAQETPERKPAIMRECFGLDVTRLGNDGNRYSYSATFDGYLSVTSGFEFAKDERWRLVRQPLSGGMVFFSENSLNDFFGDCSQRVVGEGIRNLRAAPFPRQLFGLRDEISKYIPAPKTKVGRSYVYIEELMKHPVSDGRHRLVWLVLAPYLVNVKSLDDKGAIERIESYVSQAGEMRAMKRFVEYNVKRARRNGLMPPTLRKLKAEHPDMFSLLPKEVVALEGRAS
jgi:hypothetical protein